MKVSKRTEEANRLCGNNLNRPHIDFTRGGATFWGGSVEFKGRCVTTEFCLKVNKMRASGTWFKLQGGE